jgi:peptide-methionine (R)-S-oxide reductase
MKYVLFSALIALFLTSSCQQPATQQQEQTATTVSNTPEMTSVDFPETIEKVEKTKEEWQSLLTDFEYKVLREAGTERAFTGDLLDNKKEGVYTCRGCQLPLFASDTKFKSGTGWPSFYEPIKDNYVTDIVDRSYGMVRTEVVCARCDGHLGHVFPDGPKPTGLRYCINAVSLDFVATEELP